jgi:hypothetical protein
MSNAQSKYFSDSKSETAQALFSVCSWHFERMMELSFKEGLNPEQASVKAKGKLVELGEALIEFSKYLQLEVVEVDANVAHAMMGPTSQEVH